MLLRISWYLAPGSKGQQPDGLRILNIAQETGQNHQNLSDQAAHGQRWEEAYVYFETEKYSVAAGYYSKYSDYCV